MTDKDERIERLEAALRTVDRHMSGNDNYEGIWVNYPDKPEQSPAYVVREALTDDGAGGDKHLRGCQECGQWDRDENGRLMCCCPPDRYAMFHPPTDDTPPANDVCREELPVDTAYYAPDPLNKEYLCRECKWQGNGQDIYLLKHGLVYLRKNDAGKAAKKMLPNVGYFIDQATDESTANDARGEALEACDFLERHHEHNIRQRARIIRRFITEPAVPEAVRRLPEWMREQAAWCTRQGLTRDHDVWNTAATELDRALAQTQSQQGEDHGD